MSRPIRETRMLTTVWTRTFFFAACVLLVPCAASSARAQSAFERSADAFVDAYARDGRFSGAVLVSQGGNTVFERAYGLADRSWDLPNTLDTRFEIGSLTKAFTAMAIAQLAAAGKLGLEDPVGKYYARAPETWKTITIHHLLTHTSGIASNDVKDYSKGITVPYSFDALIETFRDRPLSFEP